MNMLKKMTIASALIIGLSACSDDDNNVPNLDPVTSDQVANLHAPQETDYTQNPPAASGDFVRFSFATGQTTTSDTEWDIALRGTTILVNGGTATGIAEEPSRNGNAGVYLVDDTFANVTEVNTAGFNQDSAAGLALATGSDNGWYTYDPSVMAIRPIPGKVLVFRTHDGRYAKVEILSYYRDAPAVITEDIALNDLRYYTFNYVYQPNEAVTTF